MLHLIWYIIVGFLAGCVAKALLHTSVNHVDDHIGHCGLNHRRRCHASVLPAKRWGSISPRGFNCFHTRSDFSPLSLAQVPPASAARLD